VDILKLNADELELITGWFSHYNNDTDRIKAIRDRFGLQHIIVTRGKRGAIINQGDMFWEHAGFSVAVADTVGSGDAFTAAVLWGLIHDKEMPATLEFANRVAAFVTSRQGACPPYALDQIVS
jgi:fructokinase